MFGCKITAKDRAVKPRRETRGRLIGFFSVGSVKNQKIFALPAHYVMFMGDFKSVRIKDGRQGRIFHD